MNQNKVHSQGNVPFSWENKPGVSKTTNQGCPNEGHHPLRLPSPPCRLTEKTRVAVHDIRIPLPPCTFQLPPPPSRCSSRKGSFRNVEDPFMVALKECIKGSTAGKGKLSKNDIHVSSGLKKKGLFNNFSCKHSCAVVDDNFVKNCQLPHKKHEEG